MCEAQNAVNPFGLTSILTMPQLKILVSKSDSGLNALAKEKKMAIRTITKYGKDDILKKVCRSQLTFDDRLAVTLDDMADTMYEAEGVGLAAPQVGILRRFVVIDIGQGLIELVNPVIVEKRGEQREVEGCLSVEGKSGVTVRPMYVKVRGQNRKGENIVVEGEGLLARALCHEIDHLDGILFLDRLENK